MDGPNENPAPASTGNGAHRSCSWRNDDKSNFPNANKQGEDPRRVLHYGTSRTPLASIVPDSTYPNMWRIVWPDGQTSDIANLDRCKEAAIAICERGPPPRNRTRLHWRLNRSERPPVARTAPRARVA
jgi:hypothetical protein